MNYQVFSYMPSSSVATADPPPRPIRVTPSALSSLLYAILYSIEFQSPVGPRAAMLREHSAGRNSGSAGSTGGGVGSSGGPAAPSAAALLTSAVSVMSSFWGRTSTNTTTTSEPTSFHQKPHKSLTTFGGVEGSTTAGTGASSNAPLSFPRALTLAEEAEQAALQRQHEQPFVVPVTQVLHKLGGVHITVRERHNPTITTAYARAMEEVDLIVAEHAQRLARLPLRSPTFPCQSSGAVPSASPSATTLIHTSSTVTNSASAKEENTVERCISISPSSVSAAAEVNSGRAQQPTSPTSPTSASGFMVRIDSPVSNGADAATSANRGNDNHSYNSSSDPYGGHIDELIPGPDEVGLVLSVRLLSKEVTRWRITHERPLAEWRFPIIRTSNERMMIRPRAQSTAFTSSAASAAGEGFLTQDSRDTGIDGGNSARNFILVNSAAQVHQVLEFILKTSYQTTSLETFTDFTSGELVFDAHVQERRRFV